jgi:sortase (surface protein transpeptidase)
MTDLPSRAESRSSRSKRSSRNEFGKTPWWRDPSNWWVAAVVLLLVGSGFLVHSLRGPQTPSVASLPGHSGVQAGAAAKVVAIRSVPVSLRIPAIGVSSSLSSLGLNADKTVQVPTKFAEPGWYKLGPTPGQIGSAVILGHVDDKKGPAVFFKLRSLKAGDKVDVSLTNGTVAHFAVKSVATYSKAQFPAAKVYASQGFAALQLVTCGGKFDKATGHYESNVVAYTTLLSTTAAKK